MKIGNLNKDLFGEISTLRMKLNIALKPNEHKNNDKSPTHIVLAQNDSFSDIEIGGAWEKQITAGEAVGKTLYSISIDDISFDKPLNCTAFPMKDGTFLIDYDRNYEQSKKTA